MTIRILYYNEGENPDEWLPALAAAMPHADIRLWHKGDDAPADYALVWHPPDELLRNRRGLKAVFNLAAGVDALLSQSHLDSGKRTGFQTGRRRYGHPDGGICHVCHAALFPPIRRI